jgi:plasmid maintenance system antidote protein VapI
MIVGLDKGSVHVSPERQFKINADTLMRMQTSYDLAQARMQLAG